MAFQVRPQSHVAGPNGWVDPPGLTGCPCRDVNEATIYDTGKDGTPSHDQFSEAIANKLAMSGKFDRIYLNRSYNFAEGPNVSGRRPNLKAIDRNGRVHAIGLASRTDMPAIRYGNLESRHNTAMSNLPPNKRGQIVVLDHPYGAADIKSALDNLAGSIR